MNNQRPTSEDWETYKKVRVYLNRKEDRDNDAPISLLPRTWWLIAIIVAIIAFLSYYGLTTLLFGQDFWVNSITGNIN